jgi:hypothetical protein
VPDQRILNPEGPGASPVNELPTVGNGPKPEWRITMTTEVDLDEDTTEEIQSDLHDLSSILKEAREHLDCAESCEDGSDLRQNLSNLMVKLDEANREAKRIHNWAEREYQEANRQHKLEQGAQLLFNACKYAIRYIEEDGLEDSTKISVVRERLAEAVKQCE